MALHFIALALGDILSRKLLPTFNNKRIYDLTQISSDDFIERFRIEIQEPNNTGSIRGNKLYLRNRKSPLELEITSNNNRLIIDTSFIYTLKLIIRLQIIMALSFIVVGLTGGTIAIVYLGFIFLILITYLTNRQIGKYSKENYKWIKSLDYSLIEK